ncbi:hypothetical protein [Paenibacillus konkukensis]|uniref:hypothetical protein n=1 Tax=Paenibacillus konkukensis TaxID=2020716 RepID=UPI00201D50B5|nr:hypothetical protein [Paenibacillus konkukensis]
MMLRESFLESYINTKYVIEPVINIRNEGQIGKPVQSSHDLASPINWENNIIEVLTKDSGVEAPKGVLAKEVKHIMSISIMVNGKEASFPTEAWLKPNITKDSDYLSWLNILKIYDKKKNKNQLAIIQRLTGDWKKGENIEENMQAQKWRVLYVESDKQVSEEIFSYIDRGDHLLGVKLVQLSSQSNSFIGFKSDISYLLPNILFPIVYPTGIFSVGVILLIIGSIRFFVARKAENL